MVYEFQGHDWGELITYFKLEQKNKPFLEMEDMTVPESVEKMFFVANETIKVSTSNKEEVERIKLINFIHDSLNEVSNKEEVRKVLNDFLDKLIETSTEYIIDDTVNMFRAIRKIESNSEFAFWFTNNLESMWV